MQTPRVKVCAAESGPAPTACDGFLLRWGLIWCALFGVFGSAALLVSLLSTTSKPTPTPTPTDLVYNVVSTPRFANTSSNASALPPLLREALQAPIVDLSS
jgi:hypothetical protein